MAYVYPQAAKLDGSPLVGSHQCVALVQHYAKAPHTSKWKEGARVRGTADIAIGTAIATFRDGKYPNQPHDNHAALYLRQDDTAIYVVDQWKGRGRPTVKARAIFFKGKDRNGGYLDPSNNGDAFSIIE